MTQGRIKAFSAGSHPIGRINTGALTTLKRHGLPIKGYTSQSWEDFEDKTIDIVITVCDNAARETCPVYLSKVVRAHWGLTDPGHMKGTNAEMIAAFEETYLILEQRISKMLALPLETMSPNELTSELNEIGNLSATETEHVTKP